MNRSRTPQGAWCCPACKNRCKTLAGINRHLYRMHKGEGFGVYRTAKELQSQKATTSPYDLNGLKEFPGE